MVKFAALVGAVTVVLGAAIYIGRAVHDRWFWRDAEYAKLRSLKAGFDLPYFEHVLGPAVFSRFSRRTGYRESTFKERDHWVQALSRNGVVELFAVTSCNSSFHPSFEIPGFGWTVELRHSRLSDIAQAPSRGTGLFVPRGHASIAYHLSGATASSYFYEATSGANPGYYKSFLWGVNDACPDWEGQLAGAAQRLIGIHPVDTQSASQRDPKKLEEFRRIAVVNTYAETAPGVFLNGLRAHPPHLETPPSLAQFHGFHIGPDRLLLRTTE